ncbi:MAG: vitamin B12-dependent ribonucleotide reductase, partial [Rhodobacteraceae bacterium]|nr:vitamin B12-dependent ribonucleotide reductase [Paracoccaceae bacterium]
SDLAHVKPEGASFDDLVRGEQDDLRNVDNVSKKAESKSLAVLKQISSSGYLRKRVPQELHVLQGGLNDSYVTTSLDVSSMQSSNTSEILDKQDDQNLGTQPVGLDDRSKARMQGYEGDPCGECGNYTLVRNGTCMKCNTCGGTSGCS